MFVAFTIINFRGARNHQHYLLFYIISFPDALLVCSCVFSTIDFLPALFLQGHSFPFSPSLVDILDHVIIYPMYLWQEVPAAKCCWFIRLWMFCSSSPWSCLFANDRSPPPTVFCWTSGHPTYLLIGLRLFFFVADISLIYHVIRGQGTIKLYVVYNVLEVSILFIYSICLFIINTVCLTCVFVLDLWQTLSIIRWGCAASSVQLSWGVVSMLDR